MILSKKITTNSHSLDGIFLKNNFEILETTI